MTGKAKVNAQRRRRLWRALKPGRPARAMASALTSEGRG